MIHRRAPHLLMILACAASACSQKPGATPDRPASAASTAAAERRSTATTDPAASTVAVSDARQEVVILGDSLTAGLGLDPADAYPTLLQTKIDARGLRYRVTNAGVSGDTSAGGLSRLDWALANHPAWVVVALGGNDALRGLPVQELTRNLSTIIERSQSSGARVVLAGMEAPPNFGLAYTTEFRQVYATLARQYHVAFVPFLLQDVAGIERLNQRDGIHPTAEGAQRVADNVWAILGPLLETR